MHCVQPCLFFLNSAIGPHKLLFFFFYCFCVIQWTCTAIGIISSSLYWCWSSGGCSYNIWWGSLSVLRTPGKTVKFPGCRGNIRQSATTLKPLKRVPCIHAETTGHMLTTQYCSRCSHSSCHWTFPGPWILDQVVNWWIWRPGWHL